MKKIKVEKAVGQRLGHDITGIIPGKSKGPVFKRGHVIRKEDIPKFHRLGKQHVWMEDPEQNEIHEEEAAIRIARAVAGSGLISYQPREGKVELKAKIKGVLKVKVELLTMINAMGDLVLVTLHNNRLCEPGEVVAGTRMIPLFIAEEKIDQVETLCQQQGEVLELLYLEKKKVGIVITGTEVYEGLIEDAFAGVIRQKVEALGSQIIKKVVVPDDVKQIADGINTVYSGGSEVILVCGGMSVDADDVTPEGIMASGARVIFKGVPILPGSMFLYSLWNDVPVLGVPACVIHDPITILDLVLPRILAGDVLSKDEIAGMGHGGLCMKCDRCLFPVCPFGK